ncbi:ATP-binding protein [Agrobacterium pusense]|uniref:ATP-binding protein n=1 Tax=Agrobacterium pusense TaxID=648995 RepID=UPI000D33A61B|nr:winged helix-turn-helix domain-containing protein [Agrobacterium pusense]PTV69807.1 hypothetical protein DBL06_25845 [Agrobacterium pusense]
MSYEFGPFRLVPTERTLERDGCSVAIGSRAFDLLTALVENGGAVVSKKDLHARVWPDMVVDEVSLRVHVSGLRKLLGEASGGKQYITNVSGRGYAFSVPVRRAPSDAIPPSISPDGATSVLPPLLSRMVGREHLVQDIAERLLRCRFLSLIGPGGIGKTTVAVATAHAAQAEFSHGVVFADLTTIVDGDLVASAIANLLGVPVASRDPTADITSAVRQKRLLLVLDNCEHIIDAVARFAEHVFLKCPDVYLLTTSRETLRVEGEHVFVVPPLEAPPEGHPLSPEEMLTFPAVRLFVDRTYASGGSLELTAEEISVAASICRRLEGVALAIELVAGRAGVHGLLQMPDLLDYRFGLYWQGRRTALPRHQTMAALHDWSYNLLSDREKLGFRRLGWIIGEFSIDAAMAICGFDDIAEASLVIEGLADRFLLSRFFSQDGGRTYRMSETARAYALEKLQRSQANELRETALGHARYYLRLLEDAIGNADTFRLTGTLASHRKALPNIRLALRWCYDDEASVQTGARLAAASAPVLLELSLLDECHRWTALALDRLPAEMAGSVEEARLQQALAVSGIIVRNGNSNVSGAFSKALAIAERIANERMRLDILAGLNIYEMRAGNCYKGLDIALESQRIASVKDPEARDLIQWMLGVAFSYSGHLERASEHLDASCSDLRSEPVRFNLCVFTQRIRAYVQFGRVLCLQGQGRAARRYALKAVEDASAYGHPIPHCIALAYAASTLIWLGDWNDAANLVMRLRTIAGENSLAAFNAVSKGLEGELAVRKGGADVGVPLLEEALDIMTSENHHHMIVSFLAALAEGLARTDRYERGRDTLIKAFRVAEASGEKFQLAEMCRLQAVLTLQSEGQSVEEARKHLDRAWDLACEHGALAFQLRVALTARHYPQLLGDSIPNVEQVLARFASDEDSHDIRLAKT